jgi:AraC-like DNA-binding protein
MATSTGTDRLRSLIDVLVRSIDEPAKGEDLARRAYLSRFHFDRLVTAALHETPAALRRRLLLERAAWHLLRGTSVTDAAFDAGYSATEAFARAFRRAFGSVPSAFRGRLHTGRLIDAAGDIGDDAIDEPVALTPPTPAFAEDAPSIRAMLGRLVFTKEMWSAAISGHEFRRDEDTTLDGLKRRLDEAGAEFAGLVRDIRNRGAWDTAFVDATCDPPESFTIGGAIAHALSWDAYRRQIVAAALRERGVVVSADPLDWERGRT